MLRLSSGLLFCLPIGLYLYPFKGKRSLCGLLAAAAVLTVSLLPMTVVLKVLFNQPWTWEASGYYRQRAMGLDIFAADAAAAQTYSIISPAAIFSHLQIFSALFAARFGFLWSTPLVVLGWIGLGFLVKRERRRGLILLGAYLPIFIFEHWNLGDEFGHRY